MKVIYTYSVRWLDTNKVRKHFLDWASEVGSEADFHGCQSYRLDVETSGKKWAIDVLGKRGRSYEVDVEYTVRRGQPKS